MRGRPGGAGEQPEQSGDDEGVDDEGHDDPDRARADVEQGGSRSDTPNQPSATDRADVLKTVTAADAARSAPKAIAIARSRSRSQRKNVSGSGRPASVRKAVRIDPIARSQCR